MRSTGDVDAHFMAIAVGEAASREFFMFTLLDFALIRRIVAV